MDNLTFVIFGNKIYFNRLLFGKILLHLKMINRKKVV